MLTCPLSHLHCSASVVLEAFISATIVLVSRSTFFLYRRFFLENRRVSSCFFFLGDWGCECCVLLSRCVLGPSSCSFWLSEMSGDVCLSPGDRNNRPDGCLWVGLVKLELDSGVFLGRGFSWGTPIIHVSKSFLLGWSGSLGRVFQSPAWSI